MYDKVRLFAKLGAALLEAKSDGADLEEAVAALVARRSVAQFWARCWRQCQVG